MDSILIIEDRPALRQVYADFLMAQGFLVKQASSVEEAREALARHEFSLLLSDYMLPGLNGLAFLEELKAKDTEGAVILMTAFGEVRLAVEAMRLGAFDFLEKPIDLNHLKLVVQRALSHRKLLRQQTFLNTRGEESETILGRSESLLGALNLAGKVAPTEASCLLLGESGVGKELFAEYIHQHSPRVGGQMVAINCASIPHELMESELFGHEKGAFTGAVARKLGLVEMADGGTLFLDEIGELPLSLQPKLLRVSQSHEFFRVGGNRVLKSDLRLVCATNRDLRQGVRDGWFREDLYYRLAVFPLCIPPLRERPGDVALLIPRLLAKKGHGQVDLEPGLLAALEKYSWPGNVRELENVLDRAVILSQGETLQRGHFPEDLFRGSGTVNLHFSLELDHSFKQNLGRLERRLERVMIEHLLERFGGNRELTARGLGVSVKTLYNKLKGFDIKRGES